MHVIADRLRVVVNAKKSRALRMQRSPGCCSLTQGCSRKLGGPFSEALRKRQTMYWGGHIMGASQLGNPHEACKVVCWLA